MTEQDDNQLIAQRREKLQGVRASGIAFPNDFRRTHLTAGIHEQYAEHDKEDLESMAVEASVCGRLMFKRVQGKVSFAGLKDGSGSIQLFLQRDNLGDEAYASFKSLDIGDVVGAEGMVFRTNRGELSLRVNSLRLLTKSLRSLPEKWHGLSDTEIRYRQRYVDLIMNDDIGEVFRKRSAIVESIRRFMLKHGYLEVETPMMQPIPGGAVARPFITYHNALDMQLYLRIAPELYLKRLVVGGIERVFEINRNFRNEGLSTRHNPEFTMLEFYAAYADYNDLMDFTERMFREVADNVLGELSFQYQGHDIDFAPSFHRVSLKQAILDHNPDIEAAQLEEPARAADIALRFGIQLKDSYGLGKIQLEIFEATVEERLIQPTFVTQFPAEVSPLARRNDDDAFVTDRFELFVGGREIVNGFSELNDAEDQAERFRQQAADKDAGDDEAMHYDADYIRALEYGLPPTAGEGIGIDRLVMLLTDSASIRDVILFPQMRPEN
ncbi:MAG: lysine--tRNA ligase [Gammaproteobacteria bacterium]|nr:lysine--tRNA ligase [Gammaproteobacteria bacterium]